MRVFIFLLFLSTTFMFSCKKDALEEFKEASVIGPDFRRCASPYCGGWFFEVGNDTLRFLTLPESSTLTGFNDSFPFPVYIQYKNYDNEWSAIPDLVEVIQIRERR